MCSSGVDCQWYGVLSELAKRVQALERQQEYVRLSMIPCSCTTSWKSIPGSEYRAECTVTECDRCLRIRELQDKEAGGDDE